MGEISEKMPLLQKRMTRRTFVRSAGAVGVVAGGAIAAERFGLLKKAASLLRSNHPDVPVADLPAPSSSEIGEASVTPTTPDETKSPELTSTSTPNAEQYIPNENEPLERYTILRQKIDSAEGPQEVKSELVGKVDEYLKIEEIQERFRVHYSVNNAFGGEPALLFELKKKWPNVSSGSYEDQIFFLRNQKKFDAMRIEIDMLIRQFDIKSLKGQFDAIDALLEAPYLDGAYWGIHLMPGDYKHFETKEGIARNVAYVNVDETQRQSFEALESQKLAPLSGDFEVQGVGFDQAMHFSGAGSPYRLQINFDSPLNARHELAHATNVSQKPVFVTPEGMLELYLQHERALAGGVTGRQYGTIEALGKPISEIPLGVTLYGLSRFVTNRDGGAKFVDDGGDPFLLALDGSGRHINDARYQELTKTGSDNPDVSYDSVADFVAGEAEVLDNLSGESSYFKAKVAWIRDNPELFQNLASKVDVRVGSAGSRTRADYFWYLREGSDGLLITQLVNGNRLALDFYKSLSALGQSALKHHAYERYNRADFETWATMVAIMDGRGTELFEDYKKYYQMQRTMIADLL